MEQPKIKAVIYGVGAIGGSIAREVLRRRGIEIVGAIDISKDKVGRDLGEVLGLDRLLGVKVSDDAGAVLSNTDADIAIHATSSYLRRVYPQIMEIVENGVNVISTCEELSYPYISDQQLAKRIDEAAKKHKVTVLGTGINPGFLMDTLAIALTGVCQKINNIVIERVIDAGKRREPFQRKIGAGLTVEDFKRKIKEKIITGHVGLEQSIAMIADALGWNLEDIRVYDAEPVVAEKPLNSAVAEIHPGMVAGLSQRAEGIIDGCSRITLNFKAYIGAEEEYDSITIDGVPEIHEKISPCVHGDIGTVSMVVNMIPKVINASPGLVTMKDLPVPSASLEDMRIYIKTWRCL